MKYKDWLNTWLELYVKPVVKIQTYDKYEKIVRLHILPNLGEYEMESLRSDILQKFVVDLTQRLAANTVNSIISVLKKSLKTAVMLGVTKRQYADSIQRPKPREKQVECFSVIEKENRKRGFRRREAQNVRSGVMPLYRA